MRPSPATTESPRVARDLRWLSARTLLACDAMIEAAKQFEGVFVAHGLAADFLARIEMAVAA